MAALSFLSKPLMIAIAAWLFGLHAGMLRHGYAFPFITHLCFGAVGGIIGYWFVARFAIVSTLNARLHLLESRRGHPGERATIGPIMFKERIRITARSVFRMGNLNCR